MYLQSLLVESNCTRLEVAGAAAVVAPATAVAVAGAAVAVAGAAAAVGGFHGSNVYSGGVFVLGPAGGIVFMILLTTS